MLKSIRIPGSIILIFVAFSVVSGGEIHDAVTDGDCDLVKQLISGDPSLVDGQSESGATPLNIAARTGHVRLAALLLDNGADIEARDGNGYTPLLTACRYNQRDIAQLLAGRGADLTAEHPSFGSAILLGYWQECINGKSGLTELLMSQGVPFDPNARMLGSTVLNLASTFSNTDMARLVMGLGADVHALSDGRGRSELTFAIECGSHEIVALLIEHEVDVNVADSSGHLPIRYAVEQGYAAIVGLLIDAGARPDVVDTTNGQTLLHLAALRGYFSIVSQLAAAGLDVNATDLAGRTPIFYAARYGHRTVVDLLIDRGGSAPSDTPPEHESVDLATPVADGSAVIWQLIKRGWAIKTTNHVLVLDPEEFHIVRPDEPSMANGCLTPSELRPHDITVIYSTYHGRPGQPAYIHQIEDSLDHILYVQSKLDAWKGCKNSVYVGPGESNTFGDVAVSSFAITETNPALGHMIEIDGLKIFYPGWPPEDFAKFKQEVQAIEQRLGQVDIVFVHADGDTGDNAAAIYCIKHLKPRLVVPFDVSRRAHLCKRLKETITAMGRDCRVFDPENPGDHYRLSGI